MDDRGSIPDKNSGSFLPCGPTFLLSNGYWGVFPCDWSQEGLWSHGMILSHRSTQVTSSSYVSTQDMAYSYTPW